MRRSVWMLSWSLWENTGFGARGNCGGFSMPWAVSVMLLGCFLPLMRRIPAESLRVKLCSEGWTVMGFWRRVRTSSITSWHWLWRTFLSAAFRHLCLRLAWQSPSIMPECSSSRGISGKNQIRYKCEEMKVMAYVFFCYLFFLTVMIKVTCWVDGNSYHIS